MPFLVHVGWLSTFINTLSVALMTRRAVALTEKRTIWQRWRRGYPLRPIVEWGIDVDCRVQTGLVRILRQGPGRDPQHPVSRSPNIDYYNELVAAIDWSTTDAATIGRKAETHHGDLIFTRIATRDNEHTTRG